MTPWERLNRAQLAMLGRWTPITYLPNRGLGAPVSESAILCESQIEEARGPGYFAAIEVDAGLARESRDEVVWTDGAVYVVATARKSSTQGLMRLTLHQKAAVL